MNGIHSSFTCSLYRIRVVFFLVFYPSNSTSIGQVSFTQGIPYLRCLVLLSHSLSLIIWCAEVTIYIMFLPLILTEWMIECGMTVGSDKRIGEYMYKLEKNDSMMTLDFWGESILDFHSSSHFDHMVCHQWQADVHNWEVAHGHMLILILFAIWMAWNKNKERLEMREWFQLQNKCTIEISDLCFIRHSLFHIISLLHAFVGWKKWKEVEDTIEGSRCR